MTKLNKDEPYYQYQLRLAGLDAPELKPALSIPYRELHVLAGQRVRDVIKGKYGSNLRKKINMAVF